MTKPSTVWGGLTGVPQRRTLVAARSKAEALRMLDGAGIHLSRYEFDGYWTDTGNGAELAVAASPGVWIDRSDPRWSSPAERRWESLL